eukprot:1001485-Pelagomonas_calceolata.AAC.2
MQTKLQQTPLKALPAKASSKGVSRCVLPPRSVVAKAAHNVGAYLCVVFAGAEQYAAAGHIATLRE